MKTNHLITLTCLTIIGFWGCSTPPKSATDAKNQAEAGGTKTRDDLRPIIKAGRPIELPYNYQNQFSSVQPAVLATLSKIEMIGGQVPEGIEKGLESMLKAKLARMGRLNIFYIFGNRTVPLTSPWADLLYKGEIELEATAPPKIDLFFDCKILLSKSEFERLDGTDGMTYTVDILLNMRGFNKQRIAPPINVTGKTEEMRVILGVPGKRLGEEAETRAIQDAIFTCFNKITHELAHLFPITAQVVGISLFDTDRMQLNKGVLQGLVRGQLVVIWTSDGGIDIPLAEAVVQPGEERSSIKIVSWNYSSPGIKNLINEIKSPGWIKQEGNKLFATTDGLPPLPPEWKR